MIMSGATKKARYQPHAGKRIARGSPTALRRDLLATI
jgi:hypothetical protein